MLRMTCTQHCGQPRTATQDARPQVNASSADRTTSEGCGCACSCFVDCQSERLHLLGLLLSSVRAADQALQQTAADSLSGVHSS